MNKKDVVLRFLGKFTGGDWPDMDGLVADFSEDSVAYVLYPTTKPVVGRIALRAEFVRQAALSLTPRSEIKAFAETGNYVFIERVDYFITHGINHNVAMNSVFEVNDDNQISAWREYYDSGEIVRQLNLNFEDVQALLQG